MGEVKERQGVLKLDPVREKETLNELLAAKPRTSPYDFQGLGLIGLKLMSEVADGFQQLEILHVAAPIWITSK